MVNEQVFTEKADSYRKGRQGYAPQAIETILREMLCPGDVVADIGAGTGLLSGEFIERGCLTYCVEPNDNMRAQAEAVYGGHPQFRSVAASAEYTGLAAGSVDLVTAGSAFHWFDTAAFRVECERILRSGRFVCVLINARDYTDPFTRAQHALCEKYCQGFTSLRHGAEKTQACARDFFGDAMQFAEFSFPLTYTKDAFLHRSLSSSYAPKAGEWGYMPYAEELRCLTETLSTGDTFVVPNVTLMVWGRIKGV